MYIDRIETNLAICAHCALMRNLSTVMESGKKRAPRAEAASSPVRASQPTEAVAVVVLHDQVFGLVGQGGPNYRNVITVPALPLYREAVKVVFRLRQLKQSFASQVGWVASAVLMLKCQLGLGILSIPASLNTLGLIPGLACLYVVAITTTWSNYMIGVFKMNHSEIYGIDDVGAKLFGRVGREALGTSFILCTPLLSRLFFPSSFLPINDHGIEECFCY